MSQASRTNITLEMFAAAFAELAEFLPTYDAVMERRDAEIARRSGIPSHWSFRTEDETDAHLKAMRIVDKELGFAEVSKRRNELELPLDRMARLIIDAPAYDVADLGLKANAVATAMPELWRAIPDDLDWPEELIRNLIESVCIVAGAKLVARPQVISPPAPLRANLN